jgi:Icc-related predicted phosphoesterase
MRLVAVADTHLFHDDLVIPDGDVFIHAGDLCRSGRLDELILAARWINALPHRHKVVVAGNHDWAFARRPDAARAVFVPSVIYLEDAACTIDGVAFYGSPWQPEFGAWAFNLPRGEALRAKWAEIPEGTDVLITHGPPAGFGDRVSPRRREGCADLRDRVRALRPALHLFGHIHEDGGLWRDDAVTFANVTTADAARSPTVLDLDPRTRALTPVDVPAP